MAKKPIKAAPKAQAKVDLGLADKLSELEAEYQELKANEAAPVDPHNVPSASEEAVAEAAKSAKSKLVRMKRGEKFADVHPSEVANFKGGGWKVA